MKCFLSYSSETDISVIKQVLGSLNIEAVDVGSVLNWGQNIVELISQEIRRSDFVFVVLDRNDISTSVEMGLSIGLKKAVFLLVPSLVGVPQAYVSDLTYCLAEPQDYEKIAYSLRLFTQSLRKKSPSHRAKELPERKSRPNRGVTLTQDQADLWRSRPVNSGPDLELAVADLFEVLGLAVVAQNNAKTVDFGADFSIWIDEVNEIFGNPILIETRSSSAIPTITVAERLRGVLIKSNARTGILIYSYRPRPGEIWPRTGYDGFFVYCVNYHSLIDSLTRKSFAEILIEIRNLVSHNV